MGEAKGGGGTGGQWWSGGDFSGGAQSTLSQADLRAPACPACLPAAMGFPSLRFHP